MNARPVLSHKGYFSKTKEWLKTDSVLLTLIIFAIFLKTNLLRSVSIDMVDNVLVPVSFASAVENGATLLRRTSISQASTVGDILHWNPHCHRYPSPVPLSGKKGIGLQFPRSSSLETREKILAKVIELETYWSYSWGADRFDRQPKHIEFIPMAWNGKNSVSELQHYLHASVNRHIESGLVKRLFGFNEPDLELQSNMTVQEALNRWPALESLNVSLISPSCAHCNGEWIEQFLTNASKMCLRVDYIGVHWYGDPNPRSFKRFLWKLHRKYQLPMIITEFAVADWQAKRLEENRWTHHDVLLFMQSMLPWLERTSWVAGYSWFSFKHDQPEGWRSALFDENDKLTELGRYYRSVKASNIYGDLTIG